jgi:GNAT superfamily N-acetyltransferase
MEVSVGALDTRDANAASRLLARAFADDPIITHYLDDPERRAIAFPAFFEGVLYELFPSTQVFGAWSDDHLVGVAAWLPPEPVEPDAAARAHAHRCQQLVTMMFPNTAGALFAGFAALESLHPEAPHWYLPFVGVEPALQGHGIGRQLLAPVLNTADETSTICYLETPFPRTHAFYEALGFARHAEPRTFAGAPQGVVSFVRAPRS